MTGSVVRASVNPNGQQVNGDSGGAAYLADGRTVVFLSAASNLVAGDTNGLRDIFAKDLVTGRITKLTPEGFGQGISSFTVSSDGKAVAFVTETVAAGAPETSQAALYTLDVSSGALSKLTTSTFARGPLFTASTNSVDSTINPNFSADGTKLVFSSSDPGLVPGDSNGAIDVFVKDLVSGSIARVSTTGSGAQTTSVGETASTNKVPDSYHAFFTAEGSKIVFTSNANDLVAADTNGRADTFIKDLATGAISLVSADLAQLPSDLISPNLLADAISPDGSKLLLESFAFRSGGGGIPRIQALFLQDIQTGALTPLDQTNYYLGTGTYNTEFSADGSKVIYNKTDYSAQSPSGASAQTYIKDLATGIRGSVSGPPSDGGSSFDASFSPIGRKVVFSSTSGELVFGDTNQTTDVFVQDLFNPVFGQQVTDASGTGGKVFALYEGLLGRVPDSLGLEVNTGFVDGGGSLNDLARAMLGSPEGQARSGAATNTAFVTQLYRTTLHREPDAPGLDNWVKFLEASGSRAEVGVGFSLSTEHLTAIQPQLSPGVIVTDAQTAQAARLYYAVFDRAPDAGGLAGWTSYLKQGGSLAEAANAFLNSSESKAAGTTDNTAFVKSLYTNALDRPADAAGLANWVGYLDHGGSRGEVTAAIANSVEAQVHLTGVIENGWFLSA